MTIIMASLALLKRQLITVIKRFKFEEWESTVMPIFPEISFNRVKLKLAKNHKSFSTVNAARVIEETLNSINLKEKNLRDRLDTLEVIDVSRHDKRKTWYGYELTGTGRLASYFKEEDIAENIRNELQTNDINADVKVVTHDNVTFVCIKKRTKTKRGSLTTPIFFALFLKHKHFFCSRKVVSLDLVRVIAVILGFTSCKGIKLSGRDVRSLIRLLWIKQQGVLSSDNVNRPLVYTPSAPVVTDIGIDYTQSKQLKSYNEQCFSKDPPTFELLAIKASDTSIQHRALASKLPAESISMNWEFHSRNVPKFLSALIEKRVFVLPLPDYVSNLMTFGKNRLTLRHE